MTGGNNRELNEIEQPRPLREMKLTSLRHKYLRNGDYFAIISFCSHSLLRLTNYATGGVVRAL